MKHVTTLIALSVLALAGCSEDGSSGTTAQNTATQEAPATNPFEPAPENTTSDTSTASNDAPVSNEPDQQAPTTQTTGGAGGTSNPTGSTSVDTVGILNGSSSASIQSAWRCIVPGAVDDDVVIALAFFADNTGVYADGVDTFITTWVSNGPFLELTAEGQFFAQLDNVVVNAPAGTLRFTFVLTDGRSGSLNCDLVNLEEGSGGSTTQADPDPMTSPVNGGGSGQGSLINTITGGELDTFWQCQLGDGSQAALIFLDGGVGALITATYPDGITMAWAANSQGLSIVLEDGNQIATSAVRFTGTDDFQVDTVNFQGTTISGMACTRLAL